MNETMTEYLQELNERLEQEESERKAVEEEEMAEAAETDGKVDENENAEEDKDK